MKRVVLVFAVCMLVVPAPVFADLFTIDVGTASLFHKMSVSTNDYGSLNYIGLAPGNSASQIGGEIASYFYGANMQGGVGFSGSLTANPSFDTVASMRIGFDSTGYLGSGISGLGLSLSNDDQQVWEYKLYAKEDSTYHTSDGWLSLAGGTQAGMQLIFDGFNGSAVEEFGFIVQFNKATTGGGSNYSDDFHTSVVPVPGALLIGLLGLGTAGLKLRKKLGKYA